MADTTVIIALQTYRNRMTISYDFLRKYSLYLVLWKRSYPFIHETFYQNRIKVKVDKLQKMIQSHWSISCWFHFCLKSHFLIITYNWYFTLYCTAFETVDRKPRIFSTCDSFSGLGNIKWMRRHLDMHKYS